MYHDHFGLQRAPFRITPDTDLFFAGGGRGEVLEALVYAVTSGEGIVKVTGEVGTGKTMLCRMLEVRLPASVEVVYIANPSLSPEDILHAIALEMNLPVEGGVNRLTVMHSLQQRLLDMHAQNRRVVVFVEEAQGMPMETLEEIRLLSNLETQRDKLLQIVLFGQPELDEALNRSNIRQLRERITHSFRLEPLSRDEVREYVRFRMRAVGYRGPDVFKEGAYRHLARASEGLVRRVNILSDKALLAAFADDTHNVGAGHMKIAIEDGNFGTRPKRRAWWLAAVGMLLAAAGTLLVVDSTPWQQRLQQIGVGDPAPALPPSAAPLPSAAPVVAAVDPPAAPAAAPATPEPTAAGMPSPSSPVAHTAAPRSGAIEGAPASPGAPVENGAPPAQASDAVLAAGAGASSSLPAVAEPAATPPAAASETAVDTPAPSAGVEDGSTDMAAPELTAVLTSATPVVAGDASAPSMPAAPATIAVPAPSAAVSTETSRPATAADAAPTPAAVAGARSDTPLLTERVAATTAWLKSARGSNLCIQLLLADAARRVNLESFLRRMQRLGVYEHIYVYETVIGGRDWFGVLYGDFSSFDTARETLEGLPEELRRHKPFIRNVRDIVGPG